MKDKTKKRCTQVCEHLHACIAGKKGMTCRVVEKLLLHVVYSKVWHSVWTDEISGLTWKHAYCEHELFLSTGL